MYAIGNSIGRQALFNMVELLGGNPTKREDQRDMCPKHETTWGDSCHQDFGGVKFKYLYINYPDGFHYADRNGFPYFKQKITTNGKEEWKTGPIAKPNGAKGYLDNANDNKISSLYADDNCINQDADECFARFFEGAKKEDVLFFTHGLPTVVDDEPPHSSDVGLDSRAWVTASASALRSHIQKHFPGQVFRATMAEANKNQAYAYLSPGFKRTNELTNPIWAPGSEELPWYAIDQWAINENRHEFYSDHLHFNGILCHAALFQMLNELCPGGGTTTWTYPEDGLSSTAYKNMDPLIMRLPQGRQNWFVILYQGKRHNIPNMDTLNGMEIPDKDIRLTTAAEMNSLPEGDPVPACDKDTPPGCKDNMYYRLLHKLPLPEPAAESVEIQQQTSRHLTSNYTISSSHRQKHLR